jgi:hypothetical protein
MPSCLLLPDPLVPTKVGCAALALAVAMSRRALPGAAVSESPIGITRRVAPAASVIVSHCAWIVAVEDLQRVGWMQSIVTAWFV